MLYNWLYPLHTEFSFLNVFRYQSFRIIYAAVTAFLIAFILAPWVIRKLQEIKLGQQVRDDGPKRQQLHRRLHRRRVGVVTIVDDFDALTHDDL